MDTTTASAPVPASKLSGFTMPKSTPAPAEPVEAYHEPEPEVEAADRTSFSDTSERPSAVETVKAFTELTYAERIAKFEMTMDQAMGIVDALTVDGVYTETFKISKSASVVLSTRTTRFNKYLTTVIDTVAPKKAALLNQMMSEYQLAASLVSYGDLRFAELEDGLSSQEWIKALDARLDFIKKLPTAVFAMLCAKQADFDTKMMVVLSEGFDENF